MESKCINSIEFIEMCFDSGVNHIRNEQRTNRYRRLCDWMNVDEYSQVRQQARNIFEVWFSRGVMYQLASDKSVKDYYDDKIKKTTKQ